ncbi:MAG: PAS domain S-box protein [Ignavibacteriae bacterium]|nr:PAS domain S-box protein [Ignavibacteriota bacterium]NOG96433.1 PAS domain S-box protein [Ignavibacteriota bacterium]
MPNSELLNKEDLVAIIDSVDIGIIFVDKESRFAFVNKVGEKIRSIESKERIGTSVLDCHHHKVREKVTQDMNSFKQGDYASRHKIIKTNGHYFDNTYNVVKDEDGNFLGVALLSQDITEKKYLEDELKKANAKLEWKIKERTKEINQACEKLKVAEKQLLQSEKMAAIGQFVSGLAHEINNPLDGIQNCIRAVIADPNDKEQTGVFLPLALEGLYKIEVLVKQLLEYAKPKSSEMKSCNIKNIVEESISIVRFKLKEKKIELHTHYENEDLEIHGEAHYVGQVFVNLLINAIDACEEKEKIEIKIIQENENVRVKIIDSGCGIAAEDIKKIYDPFYTTKQKKNGTGLGLYLSYNVIKAHGGDIFVKSEIDKGSEFMIELPLAAFAQKAVIENKLIEELF